MLKSFTVVLVILLIIGAALFWNQIVDVFQSMSPLEALQVITTYLLHIAVGTICVVIIAGVPQILGPWLKTFRWKQRQARRSPAPARTVQHVPGPRRLNTDQLFKLYLLRQLQPPTHHTPSLPPPSSAESEHRIHWDW